VALENFFVGKDGVVGCVNGFVFHDLLIEIGDNEIVMG
jgi:hypothetical protein